MQKNEIAMLYKRVKSRQINVCVDEDLKSRYIALKSKGVDMSEESRKAFKDLIDRLEKAVR